MGSTNVGSTLRFTPIAPKPSIIGISSSSTTKVSFNSSNQNFHFFSSEDSGSKTTSANSEKKLTT